MRISVADETISTDRTKLSGEAIDLPSLSGVVFLLMRLSRVRRSARSRFFDLAYSANQIASVLS
jgi:hypothetical protein